MKISDLFENDEEGRLETRTVDDMGRDDVVDDEDDILSGEEEETDDENFFDDEEGEDFDFGDEEEDVDDESVNNIWTSVSSHEFVTDYEPSRNTEFNPHNIVKLSKTELTKLQSKINDKLRSSSKPVGNYKNDEHLFLTAASSFVEAVLQKVS